MKTKLHVLQIFHLLFFPGATQLPPNGDFYLPPQPQFHPPPNFLPPNGLVPQLPLNEPSLLRPSLGPMDQLSLRISPVSNSQSPTAQETKIHSTVDQSTSENSDDEDIDVVKSAFVPIKPGTLILQEVQHPDSTVQDKELKKSELKAPSAKSIKSLVEEKSTKIHGQDITAAKSVRRPY